MSTPSVSSVAPPIVPTTTTSVGTSVTPSSSPTSSTPTSPTQVPPTTSSPVTTSPVSTPSSSSSSSTSVPPSTTSSSTTSSTSSTTTPPTSLSSSSFSSVSYKLQTSDGQVFTLTSFVTESSSPTQPPTNKSSSNNGFIHNKAAMAGVFSVVGVCAIVLAFFLFTSYLRRRRAREFDREIEEAAAAAATARPPDFDDYDYSSAAGGYGHYSETSHGTLSQAPLSHDQPRNDQSRSQDGSYDPYAGAGVSGAAGIGARGRSVRNGGQQDPYAALSNPPEQYEMHETGRTWQQGNPLVGPGGTNFDILQAAGLSSSDPYAVTREPSTRAGLSFGQNQSGASGLTRRQSQGVSILPTTAEGYPMPVPTPAPVYPEAPDAAVPNEKARYSASYAPVGVVSTLPPDVEENAYDGYQEQPSATLNNPHSPVPRAGEDVDEEQNARAPYSQEREEAARLSLADDEDYGYTVGQRVLRVANE